MRFMNNQFYDAVQQPKFKRIILKAKPSLFLYFAFTFDSSVDG